MPLFFPATAIAPSGVDGGTTPPGSTGGTAGTLTTVWADKAVDLLGVNTHVYYTGTPYMQAASGDASAAATLVRKLQGLGCRHVRETLAIGNGTQRNALAVLAAAGIDVTFAASYQDTETQRPSVASITTELSNFYNGGTGKGKAVWISPVNEPDRNYNTATPPAGWASDIAARQQSTYNALHPLGFKILTPSVAFWRKYAAAFGDLTNFADGQDAHNYQGGNKPSTGIDGCLGSLKSMTTGLPVYMTECGYHNGMTWRGGNPPAPEDVCGIYGPRLLLEHLIRGVARCFPYELVNEPNAANAREQNFGLCRSDWSNKPMYTSIANFTALVGDPGATFFPQPLTGTVTGPADLKFITLGKRDGSYMVAVWRDVALWAPSATTAGAYTTVTPATATLTLGTSKTVRRYTPHLSTAVQATSAGTTHTASLAGQVELLQVMP